MRNLTHQQLAKMAPFIEGTAGHQTARAFGAYANKRIPGLMKAFQNDCPDPQGNGLMVKRSSYLWDTIGLSWDGGGNFDFTTPVAFFARGQDGTDPILGTKGVNETNLRGPGNSMPNGEKFIAHEYGGEVLVITPPALPVAGLNATLNQILTAIDNALALIFKTKSWNQDLVLWKWLQMNSRQLMGSLDALAGAAQAAYSAQIPRVSEMQQLPSPVVLGPLMQFNIPQAFSDNALFRAALSNANFANTRIALRFVFGGEHYENVPQG